MFQLYLEQISTKILVMSVRFCNLCYEAMCNGTVDPLLTILQMIFLI